MENFENNVATTMETAVATTETAEVVSETTGFLAKHGKDLIKVGGGVALGVGATIGVKKLAGFIKKKWTERKARKAEATAEPVDFVDEEVPEETQE